MSIAEVHATELARAGEQEQLGHWAESARLYAQAFRAATLRGRAEEAADALRGQARVLTQLGEYEAAEELVELSREIAERSGIARSAARALNVLGNIRYAQRDWLQARTHYLQALEMALDLGDDDLVGLASQNAGVVAGILGDSREARVAYLEAIGSFVRSGNSESALHAYNNLAIACAELHEWLEAEMYFSRAIEIAERLSRSPMLAKLYGNRAEPLIHIGELEQAEATLDRAEREARSVGDRLGLVVVGRWRATIARLRGEYAAAAAQLEHALALGTEPSLERAEVFRELGELLRVTAGPLAARDAYRQAFEVFVAVGAEIHANAMLEEIARLG